MRAIPNDPNNEEAVLAAEAANAIFKAVEDGLEISEYIEDHGPETATGAYLRFCNEEYKRHLAEIVTILST